VIYKTHCLRGHPSKGTLDVINEVLAECEKQLDRDRQQAEQEHGSYQLGRTP
jgi:hypothetical protein